VARTIDLTELSRELGFLFEDVEVAPGVVINQTHWRRTEYLEVKQHFKNEMLLYPDDAFSIYNSPDPWATVALVRELGVTYIYPFPGHPEETVLDLTPLEFGTPEYNYGVQFQIREESKCVHINMTSDDPSLPHGDGTPHTFRLQDLPKVKVPPIGAGKDIYLHAWGMYSVMCCVAATFAEKADSVFLACHDGDYYCCATNTPQHHIGCRAPRAWENTLPHC